LQDRAKLEQVLCLFNGDQGAYKNRENALGVIPGHSSVVFIRAEKEKEKNGKKGKIEEGNEKSAAFRHEAA